MNFGCLPKGCRFESYLGRNFSKVQSASEFWSTGLLTMRSICSSRLPWEGDWPALTTGCMTIGSHRGEVNSECNTKS